MILGGGIAGAIQSLKQNKALLNKRKKKDFIDVYGQGGVTKLNLKESTEQDMKIIRKKIEGYKREERMIWLVSICVTATIIYGLYVWMAG